MSRDDTVPRETLFETIVAEASGFYRSVLTVATAFLGGTLVFLKEIAPSPGLCSLGVLGFGWSALIASVACVIWVRRLNLDFGWRALEGDIDAARRLGQRTRMLSNWAAALLVVGMIFLMLFGFLNVGASDRTGFLDHASVPVAALRDTVASDQGVRRKMRVGHRGPTLRVLIQVPNRRT